MRRALLSLLVLGPLVACVKPPDVVLVDRRTVLEMQAAGELVPLENALQESVLLPRGGEFTRAELLASGADLSEGSLSRVLEVHSLARTESELIDELLVRRCIGEGRAGVLVETPRTCVGSADEERVSDMVQRVNRGRRHLFRELKERFPSASEEKIRVRFRELHLAGVVCGGQIQTEEGEWTVKECR